MFGWLVSVEVKEQICAPTLANNHLKVEMFFIQFSNQDLPR